MSRPGWVNFDLETIKVLEKAFRAGKPAAGDTPPPEKSSCTSFAVALEEMLHTLIFSPFSDLPGDDYRVEFVPEMKRINKKTGKQLFFTKVQAKPERVRVGFSIAWTAGQLGIQIHPNVAKVPSTCIVQIG